MRLAHTAPPCIPTTLFFFFFPLDRPFGDHRPSACRETLSANSPRETRKTPAESLPRPAVCRVAAALLFLRL